MRTTLGKKIRLGLGLGLGLGLVTGTAGADAPAPDLQLHHAPARLHMRAHLQTKTPVTTAAVTKPADPNGGMASKSDASTSSTYHPIPTDKRDIQERVIFKVNAGYQLDSAPASGDTLRGGAALPPGFSDTRPWVLGDVVLGTRDVLLPSLNGYFLANYQFDASDALASRSATITPGDATDQRVAIKAGYAEYGTEDKGGNKLWIRAGRQYRQDGGAAFAYFDGATLGYRDSGYAFSAFGGQRVALYLETPNGITFGATAMLDFKKLKDLPFKVGVDYQGLSITELNIDGTNNDQLRQLIALYSNIDIGKRGHLDLRLRLVDGGANNGIGLGIPGTGVDPSTGGIQFGRASARLRVAASRDLMIVADLEQRGSGDLAYDLAAPSAIDVLDIARQVGLGVGLYQPAAATILGGQVDWRHGNHEVLGFARTQVTEGTVVTADQVGWVEAGAALAGSPVPNTWVTAQYKFRSYFLNTDVNNAAMVVSPFGDTSGSGLSDMHEMSLDGWWRTPSSAHQLRIGAGLFYRIYDLVTPYVTTDTDGRGGARLDAQLMLTHELHLRVSSEVAQSSPTMQRDLGTMVSLRAALEARW